MDSIQDMKEITNFFKTKKEILGGFVRRTQEGVFYKSDWDYTSHEIGESCEVGEKLAVLAVCLWLEHCKNKESQK